MVRSRLRSYTLMLVGALAGGLLGAAFDQVTVSLSPAYFIVGKGMSVDPADLRLAAAWTGFRGGLALGVLVVGVGLWLEPRVALRWTSYFATMLASAVLTALVGGALMWSLDPFGVRVDSAGLFDPREADAYLVAWGAHVGVYVGTVFAVALPRRNVTARTAPPAA